MDAESHTHTHSPSPLSLEGRRSPIGGSFCPTKLSEVGAHMADWNLASLSLFLGHGTYTTSHI